MSVIAQGIKGGCVNIPLHKVILVSDLVTGSVVVGARPTLSSKGVSLLLGNDFGRWLVILILLLSQSLWLALRN